MTWNYIFPQSQYHRDLTAENIPYVILCDINSVSMGEVEEMFIREVLPTSYIIGERTFGATGPLQPVDYIDLTYGGPFGNINTMHHNVYTSTFEALIGGQVPEGIGCVPDKEVLRKVMRSCVWRCLWRFLDESPNRGDNLLDDGLLCLF